ncbi:MAG: SRPBCC domain-containing protein [Marinilabiliaceae bacterium]|jgi:activator of HSP90 ATPase|nr:SRPBCC domain-containing protein [Marinilabiliaceae bacterium]
MKTFKKTFTIHADIEDVYAALTNQRTIELWSGYPAEMEPVPGSEFSMWEGDITGLVLEVEPMKRIVQEWFFGEQEGKSIVTIILIRDFGNTQLTVEHINIPDDDFENISEGWREYYIGAIENFLNPNF